MNFLPLVLDTSTISSDVISSTSSIITTSFSSSIPLSTSLPAFSPSPLPFPLSPPSSPHHLTPPSSPSLSSVSACLGPSDGVNDRSRTPSVVSLSPEDHIIHHS